MAGGVSCWDLHKISPMWKLPHNGVYSIIYYSCINMRLCLNIHPKHPLSPLLFMITFLSYLRTICTLQYMKTNLLWWRFLWRRWEGRVLGAHLGQPSERRLAVELTCVQRCHRVAHHTGVVLHHHAQLRRQCEERSYQPGGARRTEEVIPGHFTWTLSPPVQYRIHNKVMKTRDWNSSEPTSFHAFPKYDGGQSE